MSAFRQWLVKRRDEAAAELAEQVRLYGVRAHFSDVGRELKSESDALNQVLFLQLDAEHPAHDPLTCPCCLRYGAHIVELEEEHDELVALTEEIREAGRALATLAEHRMEGCLRNHGVKGRCPGCERDEAIERWAKANGRWSMRESAGGEVDG